MAKKDRIDMHAGSKLRRLTVEQCETADAIFAALSEARDERKPECDATPDASVGDIERHRGPARLQSPFEGLSL